MKKLFRIFAVLFMCAVISGNIGMETYAYSSQTDSETTSISPQANIIEWRYKVENGNLYKRQYDCTNDEWIGSWILVS